MPDATFACPDLTTFARLDGLGLEVMGQRLERGRAVLACRVVDADGWCRRCGCEGVPRDSVTRVLAHEPLGWRPTILRVTIVRYRCTGCGHVWRQDTSKAAAPRVKLSRGGLRWALEGIVCQHLTVARVAEALDVVWNTANDAVLAEGKRVLISDGGRFDGVTVIGVDEHVHADVGERRDPADRPDLMMWPATCRRATATRPASPAAHRTGGLDLRARLVLGQLLDGAELAVTRVVDHHVEAAEVLVHLLHRGEVGGAVGHVERDRQHQVSIRVDQVLHRRDVPRSRRHPVALQRRLGPTHGRIRATCP
jgi:hypothetical protein